MNVRIIALTLTISACGAPIDPEDIPDGVPTGGVAIAVDATSNGGLAESAVDELWLRLEDVLVEHDDEGWISVGGDRMDLDLNTLIDGDAKKIGGGMVYEGSYSTVRLVIVDSWVVVAGVEEDLTIERFLDLPGDGYDFAADFFVDANSTTTATLVWNLDTELTESGGAWTLGTTVAPDVVINDR